MLKSLGALWKVIERELKHIQTQVLLSGLCAKLAEWSTIKAISGQRGAQPVVFVQEAAVRTSQSGTKLHSARLSQKFCSICFTLAVENTAY